MSGLETETDRGRRNSYVRGCASVKRMCVPATFGIYNPSRSLKGAYSLPLYSHQNWDLAYNRPTIARGIMKRRPQLSTYSETGKLLKSWLRN